MMQGRCLIVTTHYLPLVGGAPSVYDAMARCFPERFHILTGARDYTTGALVSGLSGFDQFAPYKITRLDRVRPNLASGKLGVGAKLKAYLDSWRINRVLVQKIQEICHNEGISTICIGAAEAFTWLPGTLKRCTNQRIVYYTHGEEFSQKAHSARAEENRKKAIAASDGIITVSNFTLNLLVERYAARPERIKLLHNGVDFEKFATPVRVGLSLGIDLSKFKVVVAAGRMVARKGFDKLIDAWPDIVAQVPDAQLLLCGTGPMSEPLHDRIAELGLEGSVHQLGYVPDEELIAVYQAADLFVMPNRTMPDGDTEGFGLVFLEAAAAGVSSVGGRAGGAVDAILDGDTGLLVNGEDTDDIASAVSGLLKDDDRRLQMGQSARSHAQKNDWNNKAKELLEFFDEL